VSKIFEALTSSDPSDPPIRNRELHTWGRTLVVPESSSKVAKFTFEDLCGKALSAADYLEVTKTFGTVFVLDVPKMGLHSKDMVCRFFNMWCGFGTLLMVFDQARRFITFIDGSWINSLFVKAIS
jgi:predicted ATPase